MDSMDIHGIYGSKMKPRHIPQELCSEVDAPRRPSWLLCGRWDCSLAECVSWCFRMFVCFSSCSSWISSSHVRFFSENSTKWGWKVIFRSHSSPFWQFKLGRIFQVSYSKVSKVSKVSCVKKSVSVLVNSPISCAPSGRCQCHPCGTGAVWDREVTCLEVCNIELTCEYIIKLYNIIYM